MTDKNKIFKLLLLSPFLISIPFFCNSQVQAGLEFQWDQDSGYRRLKWFQKDGKKKSRNTIFFFLRSPDRKSELLKITMNIPKTFKSTLKEKKINFCQVKIGGYESRTNCIKDIPADIEISEDNSTLNIFPYKPIPSNKDSYAIVFKVFNPKRTGLYQFHSFGQYVMKNPQYSQMDPVSSYLGSWTILID